MQSHNDYFHKIFMCKKFHILNTQIAKMLVPQIDANTIIQFCHMNIFMHIGHYGLSDFYANPCWSSYNLISFIGIIFHFKQFHIAI